MARATEVAAIKWLRSKGFAVPEVLLIQDANQRSVPVPSFGPPWIVKPDLAIGGKGLRGAVRRVEAESELSQAVHAVGSAAAMDGDFPPIAVEQYIEGSELYLSISVDETSRSAMLRFSLSAGIGFDARMAYALALGLDDEEIRSSLTAVFDQAGLEQLELRTQLTDLAARLWELFRQTEAVLLEFNPIRWDGRRAIPVGFACEFDDNAHEAARHAWPVIDARSDLGRKLTDRELLVEAADRAQPRLPMVRFLELEGDTALIVVGGGAALLCFDHLYERGARPACYADYSPGAGSEKLKAVVQAGLSIPGIKGAIFGAVVVSLADVVELARGLVDGIHASGVDPQRLPIVARIAGPNEEAAQELMNTVPGLIAIGREQTLEEACDRLLREMGLLGAPSA